MNTFFILLAVLYLSRYSICELDVKQLKCLGIYLSHIFYVFYRIYN